MRAAHADTSTATLSASLKATLAVSARRPAASAGNIEAILEAAPMELLAAFAASGGSPATACSMLRPYTVFMADPMMATPRAPATMRVTSFMADATPALASGTAPMTASVEGAMVLPRPKASTKIVVPTTQYAVSGCQSVIVANTTVYQQQAQRHHFVGTQLCDQAMAIARTNHNSQCQRHHPQAGLQWRVALDELQILCEPKNHTEHSEKSDRDCSRSRGESRVLEEREVEHRVLRLDFPSDEGSGKCRATHEARHNQTVRPTARRRFDDGKHQGRKSRIWTRRRRESPQALGGDPDFPG